MEIFGFVIEVVNVIIVVVVIVVVVNQIGKYIFIQEMEISILIHFVIYFTLFKNYFADPARQTRILDWGQEIFTNETAL